MPSTYRMFGLALAAGGLWWAPSEIPAADWMFEPSYYSHVDSPAYVAGIVPNPRAAYRPGTV
jgi:hypothetical protein